MKTKKTAAELAQEIEALIKGIIPAGCYTNIRPYKVLGTEAVKIFFAASDKDINGVQEQKPQAVSLKLYPSEMELTPQVFGGMGGQHVYKVPNMDDPKEKYYAMIGVKIPFRKPKPEEKHVLAAVSRFAEAWVKAIQENREKLTHQNLADYSIF